MAVLSKNGIELARYMQTSKMEDGSQFTYTYSVRSNGKILRNLSVKNYVDNFKHTYGWKRWKSIKPGTDMQAFIQKLDNAPELIKIGLTKISN